MKRFARAVVVAEVLLEMDPLAHQWKNLINMNPFANDLPVFLLSMLESPMKLNFSLSASTPRDNVTELNLESFNRSIKLLSCCNNAECQDFL